MIISIFSLSHFFFFMYYENIFKDDVNKFVTEKVNIENASEKNDSQLLIWLGNINETIKEIGSYMEYLDKNAEIFNLFEVNYAKCVCIQISKAVSSWNETREITHKKS